MGHPRRAEQYYWQNRLYQIVSSRSGWKNIATIVCGYVNFSDNSLLNHYVPIVREYLDRHPLFINIETTYEIYNVIITKFNVTVEVVTYSNHIKNNTEKNIPTTISRTNVDTNGKLVSTYGNGRNIYCQIFTDKSPDDISRRAGSEADIIPFMIIQGSNIMRKTNYLDSIMHLGRCDSVICDTVIDKALEEYLAPRPNSKDCIKRINIR